MDFERNLVRVLCISTQETVRGLQWALDRQEFSDRRFELAFASLGQLQQGQIAESDLVFTAIDLGQPVPVETLRRLGDRPGLCAFVHPTPQQLLSLSDLPRWVAIAWDGVAFDRVVQKIDELAASMQSEVRLRNFHEVYQFWERDLARAPDLIEWVNAPEDRNDERPR